ncbi:glycosyl hydrolase [Colletotrichum asianum]|uniref:Glycosyl hydrolase n=1 Tax=Colletotrichum asianum TaxID=702518 RepID=A0A8H3W7E7_9PEZI|nr:glycosyl hydrolase [Colletotrichum asianum]
MELTSMDTLGHAESYSGRERPTAQAQARRRQINDRAVIENPLAHYTDEQLEADVKSFAERLTVDTTALLRAARVAKDIKLYDEVARNTFPGAGKDLPVQLTAEEKRALRRERDVPFSERGMWTIIITVSLAAFLQGKMIFWQSRDHEPEYKFGLNMTQPLESNDEIVSGNNLKVRPDDWKLGAANSSPFLFAAVLGCPLALPVNHYLGRKGGMIVAAILIFASSLGSAFAHTWQELFAIRLVNGIGMGLKAVSTPILASETAVGFWRGTSILAWQLWVAAGSMIGLAFNLIFDISDNKRLTFQLMVAAPLVPALALLLLVIFFCDESPRYLMRVSSPRYNPQRAYQILRKLRNTELQALRDIYLVHKSIEQEEISSKTAEPDMIPGFIKTMAGFLRQYRQLFLERRLRNALISSSTVSLAQQLCGINVLAFYSGTLFSRAGQDDRAAMYFSLGYGAVNFVFGLPAIRTIDTLGRRKWLLLTLPIMALFMLLAGVAFNIKDDTAQIGVVALFLLLFAAAYSPGLGPIPFTYASESFPLSHREAGAAFAIAVNLGFAGLLSIFFPSINSGLDDDGALYLFAGLNIVALVLVFLLLEETKRRSLEDLDLVFAVSKHKFMRHQVAEYLPWFIKHYFLRKHDIKPSLYTDLIWGSPEPSPGGGTFGVGQRPHNLSTPHHPGAVKSRLSHCPRKPFRRKPVVMSSLRLTIEDGQFRDGYGRQVVLRGLNVAADAKLPSEPDQPSHVGDDFFDGDNVKFHNRPFPKEEAHEHFSRIKRYGYNTIRYVFTWEAIEAAGPGRYDEEWIQHTIEILRIAKEYGFYVFMDPHQDVWSRFCGGSGAPMWTIYACGLNPQSFAATEAAIVHNTYPKPDEFPKMIWSTNYWRLAAATIFTMYFGGRDFAPKCIINGINIQDFLQGHFVAACAHLAKRIHEAGDLENEVIVGWESMNEPGCGLVGYADVSVIPSAQKLKKGSCPTIWQTILTGSGRACEVETWDMGGMGPYKVGRSLIDPHGEIAWLPADYDDSRYGWKRDEGWKLGECIWAQHGIWDPKTDTLLKKDYFAKNPNTGKTIDHPEFTNTYFMHSYRLYRDAIRPIHKNCIMLMQYPTLELPPQIKGTEDDDPLMGFAPHWYDGITLMTKRWNRVWNVDVVGVLRGRYWHEALSVKVGETAIRNCFKDQLASLRQEGIDRMGKHPCVMTEFGIPYDMGDKKAYKTGDYTDQSLALDANYFGAEGSGMEGHCLWVYVAKNTHQHGDLWNGEDLSVFSLDDKTLPMSPLPRSPEPRQSAENPRTSISRDVPDETKVTPDNLQRTITNPSISTEPTKDPTITNAPGLRAAEAFVRPSPVVVSGDVLQYGFDLRSCTFNLKLKAAAPPSDPAPTVVFLPEFHFPQDNCQVEVSSGKWAISMDDDEGPLVQKLKWWHGDGEQTLKVSGLVRQHNVAEGSEEDMGYLEQCQKNYANCSVM